MKYSYIELVGIPGAGKTSLAKDIALILQKEGLKSMTRQNFFNHNSSRVYKVLWSILNLTSINFTSIKLILRLSKKRGSTLRKALTRIHEQEKLEYQIRYLKKGTVVVWDGGFVQRFANLVKFGLDSKEEIVKFICRRLPKTKTLFIFLKISEEEAFNRIYERERGLLASIGSKIDNKSFKDKNLLVSELKETFLTQKSILYSLEQEGFTVFVLDGHKTVRENTETVIKMLKK